MFCIDDRQVCDWHNAKETLDSLPKTKKACRSDVALFPEMEKVLNAWVLKCRQNGYIVMRTAIPLHALKLVREGKYDSGKSSSSSKFATSAGWCTRFMNRYRLSLRQLMKIAQKLPADLENKVGSFHKFVTDDRKQHAYGLGHIGNMDETPIMFDLLGNRTVNQIGAKTVMVRTMGHEKTNFTVVLSCMANGVKLKPVVIFKRKTLPKGAKFPSGVIVQAHPKGWMNNNRTKDWLLWVWNTRPGAMRAKRSMLVWHMLHAHVRDDVKASANSLKTDLAVIPGSLTSVLQHLDVCINKLLKDRLRSIWSD